MLTLWEIPEYLIVAIKFCGAVLILAVVVEAVTEILVTSSLLDIVGLRPWASRRALPARESDLRNVRWYHTALHTLLTCGYCASVWVSVPFAACLPGGWFGLTPWDNCVVKVLLLHRLANYVHTVTNLIRRGRVKTVDLELKLSGRIEHVTDGQIRLDSVTLTKTVDPPAQPPAQPGRVPVPDTSG